MTELSKNTQVPQCDKTAVSKSVILYNEIRIGNVFENAIIESISKYGYNYSDYPEMGVFWNYFDNLKPLIISDELLLNYGFEDGIDEMELCTNNFCVYWLKFENYFEINGEKYFIDYFHTFQNLFFFLNGSELTVC
jgi:hypothetical protein